MNREILLSQLTALDFMAVDLSLYLNTHPDEKQVIEKYNSIIKEADMLRGQYEKLYGPLCSYRSMALNDKWEWIDDPWPWEYCFNFGIEENENENGNGNGGEC